MRIKFLQDYQGVKTGELFFMAGDVVEVDDDWDVRGLLAEGRAVEDTPEPEPEPEPVKPTRRKRAAKKDEPVEAA